MCGGLQLDGSRSCLDGYSISLTHSQEKPSPGWSPNPCTTLEWEQLYGGMQVSDGHKGRTKNGSKAERLYGGAARDDAELLLMKRERGKSGKYI